MLEESTGNFSASRNVYDWFQTSTHVNLNIMIKNLTEADVKVRLIDETLDVSCNLANGNEFQLHFNLFKPIYVAESSWTVTPSKLEIKLKKTDRKRWQSLEVIPEKSGKKVSSFTGIIAPASKKMAISPDGEFLFYSKYFFLHFIHVTMIPVTFYSNLITLYHSGRFFEQKNSGDISLSISRSFVPLTSRAAI